MMLVGIWLGLYWVLFSFFDHYIISGEVIGFRLFRATGLAFAIRPKDGVARQGRRGGFIFKVQFKHPSWLKLKLKLKLQNAAAQNGKRRKTADNGKGPAKAQVGAVRRFNHAPCVVHGVKYTDLVSLQSCALCGAWG